MRLISDETAANFKDGPVLDAKCKIEVANAVAHILKSVGEDHAREGQRNTPDRVARRYDEILLGYTVDPVKLLNDALFDVDYGEMVVVGDVDFWSMCEHHLLPIFGQAHVAYLPTRRSSASPRSPERAAIPVLIGHPVRFLGERVTGVTVPRCSVGLSPRCPLGCLREGMSVECREKAKRDDARR